MSKTYEEYITKRSAMLTMMDAVIDMATELLQELKETKAFLEEESEIDE